LLMALSAVRIPPKVTDSAILCIWHFCSQYHWSHTI
jgi:hypothetical protein